MCWTSSRACQLTELPSSVVQQATKRLARHVPLWNGLCISFHCCYLGIIMKSSIRERESQAGDCYCYWRIITSEQDSEFDKILEPINTLLKHVAMTKITKILSETEFDLSVSTSKTKSNFLGMIVTLHVVAFLKSFCLPQSNHWLCILTWWKQQNQRQPRGLKYSLCIHSFCFSSLAFTHQRG